MCSRLLATTFSVVIVAAAALPRPLTPQAPRCGQSYSGNEAMCRRGTGTTASGANADAHWDLDQAVYEAGGGCDTSGCDDWETCLPGAVSYSSGSITEGLPFYDAGTDQWVQVLCFNGFGTYAYTCSGCSL